MYLFPETPVLQKPGVDAVLDTSHPLVSQEMVLCALLAEGSGEKVFNDYAKKQPGVLQTGVPSWRGGQTGHAFSFPSTGLTEIRFTNNVRYPNDTGDPLSVVALVKFDDVTNYGSVLSVGETNDSNHKLTFLLLNTGFMSLDDGGVANNQSAPVASGIWTMVGVTHFSATRRTYAVLPYPKGKLAVNSVTADLAAGSLILNTNPWNIGRAFTNAVADPVDMVGMIEFVYAWKKALSVDQLVSIMTSPYQIFTPPAVRRWFLPPQTVSGGNAPPPFHRSWRSFRRAN